MTNHHFYEQSASSWHNEWCGEEPDTDCMTDEEREEAENAARAEMAKADREAADYRRQEREQMHSSRFANMDIFDIDAPF